MGKNDEPIEEPPPPIDLVAKGGATDRDNQVNLLTAKRSPAFVLVQKLVIDALRRRAEAILLDYSAQAVQVRYQLDGFWINTAMLDRPTGDAMLAVAKVIAALNYNERRALQKGAFGAEYRKKKYDCQITSQGVPTGERCVIKLIDPKEVKLQTNPELGFREQHLDQLKKLFDEESGMILVAAAPGHGLTTTFCSLLRSADRFVRNFIELQDKQKAEKAVENVPITAFDSAAGETMEAALDKELRKYPDVICTRDLVDANLVHRLCDQTAEKRLSIGAITARDCIDGLMRVLAMGVNPAKLGPAFRGMVAARLCRTLCDQCKRPYPPPPQVLQQLGIPPGRVQAFFMPHEGPLPKENPEDPNEEPRICKNCGGVGFRGRTGFFEVLIADDEFRQTLATNPSPDALRMAARRCGMKTLQEEGVVLVARGVTALPELLRVLKE